MDFSILTGKVLTKIDEQGEAIYFHCADGQVYSSVHMQDCCESVHVYEIRGDIQAVLESPVLFACEDWPGTVILGIKYDPCDSYTWTRQRIETKRGYVEFIWLGESNGYYGETPYFGYSQ